MSNKRRHRQKPPGPNRPMGEPRPEFEQEINVPEAPPEPPPQTSYAPVRNAPGILRQTSFEIDRIGDILRRKREQRGETLEAIADYLRIRPAYLTALEHSRYDELPADAYVIGFLRTYAVYLDYDGRAAIDQYRSEMAGRRRKPQLNMPQPISEGRAPTTAILVGALMAALLIYALWYGLSTSDRAVVTAPPPLPATGATEQPASTETPALTAEQTAPSTTPEQPQATAPAAPAQTPEQPAVVTPEPAPAPATTIALSAPAPALTPVPANKDESASAEKPLPKGKVYGDTEAVSRVVLRVEKESWILIADKKGNTLFDKILKPGDTYKVPNLKGLTMTSGNGGGVVLVLDGVDLPRLTDESRVVRGVPLDPDYLKAHARTE